jgi:hypothetical protein
MQLQLFSEMTGRIWAADISGLSFKVEAVSGDP